MEYRTNIKAGDRISEIGMGTAYLFEAGMEEGIRALQTAVEGGINYFDLAAGHGDTYPIFGAALADARKDLFYQIHFGADYSKGVYGWSLDLDTVKRSVDQQLTQLKTDYIDYGFIHCLDETADWKTYQENGILDYIHELQRDGVVRHMALSSHTPSVIQAVLDETDVDMLMFSINPAYDSGEGEYAHGSMNERTNIYQRCQTEGIGITVMKPFSSGQLLDAAQSPFKTALTKAQCLQYALDRPGVVSVLPGARNTEEVRELLAFHDLSPEETDYSIIAEFDPVDTRGACVYCNHCMPCPAGLDIGLINKYYDLAKAGDPLAPEHYRTLEHGASDCTGCGHCDSRCPFGVEQSARMAEIRAYFQNAR
ncbi:MAG: aldo/keto reductase [Firmicutes bacterium]|nr:aldo/keto reductase [Bacillota bacterium]